MAAPGDPVGVAPGAQWIHAATIDRVSIARTVSDSLLAFEWLLDPDGDPATNWDVPAVCSNSWGVATSHGYPPCDETFWAHLDACEAAGIVILFSAGNEGTSGLRRPADRATDDYRTAAVAAVDANDPNWPIAGFSSRGPTNCTPGGDSAIKPDIAGPGVNVLVDLRATATAPERHVDVDAARQRRGRADARGEPQSRGRPGQADHLRHRVRPRLVGRGQRVRLGHDRRLRGRAAALADTNVRFLFPDGRPTLVDPTGGKRIRVVVEGEKVEPAPGTGKLYYRESVSPGGFTVVDMEVVAENEYDAVFPSFECGARVDYYFSVETMDKEEVYNPFSAPDTTYSGDAYSGPDVAFTDDFEADTGWTVVNTEALTPVSGNAACPPVATAAPTATRTAPVSAT